jgi:putative transposase
MSTLHLRKNMLIQWILDEHDDRVERVLWIDPPRNRVVTLNIQEKNALPEWKNYADVTKALEEGEVRVLVKDPFSHLNRREEDIPREHREHRDQAWKALVPLLAGDNGEIFDAEIRGVRIRSEVEKGEHTKAFFYAILRRFWRHGQTRNALLPTWNRSGGKGKTKRAGDHKRGRPDILMIETGETTGVNITPEMCRRFELGIKKFYIDQPENSLRDAYHRTLQKYFNVGFHLEGDILVPDLPDATDNPTEGQFRYWYYKGRDIKQITLARNGRRDYENTYRPLTGDTLSMAFTSGSLLMYDSTPSDIDLVSSLDQTSIIGRPITGLGVDYFSHLITAVEVTLENAGYVVAVQVLVNVAEDKVAFCARYGYGIEPEEWPAQYIPDAVKADRGELEGYDSDNLVTSFDITLENTAPYMGSWKGLAELLHRLSKDTLVRKLPGFKRKHIRGNRDTRLNASLTLEEYVFLVIAHILYYNHHHRIKKYPLTKDMIAKGIVPIPLQLWNYGLEQRAGLLKQADPETVLLNLLPRAEVTVTEFGICFEIILYYTCPLAEQELWFEQARGLGKRGRHRWTLTAAYDPRSVDVIWLVLDAGTRVVQCTLVPNCQMFKGYSVYEIRTERRRRARQDAVGRTDDQRGRAKLNARIDHVAKQAHRRARRGRWGMSKRSQVIGIRPNRQAELRYRRSTRVQQAGGAVPEQGHEHVQQPSAVQGYTYVPRTEPIDLLDELLGQNFPETEQEE